MKVATMQQKNTCLDSNHNKVSCLNKINILNEVVFYHDSLFFQNDDTSSIAKSNPPTGAPKADAIPAAAPAEIKFRRSSELRNLKIIRTYLINASYNFAF